jgi:hypothetical protein
VKTMDFAQFFSGMKGIKPWEYPSDEEVFRSNIKACRAGPFKSLESQIASFKLAWSQAKELGYSLNNPLIQEAATSVVNRYKTKIYFDTLSSSGLKDAESHADAAISFAKSYGVDGLVPELVTPELVTQVVEGYKTQIYFDTISASGLKRAESHADAAILYAKRHHQPVPVFNFSSMTIQDAAC